MVDIARLAIVASTQDLERALGVMRQVRGEARATEQATDGMGGAWGRASGALGGASGALNLLRGGLAGVGIYLGGQQVLAYANAWQQVENQLRLVTNSTEELNRAQAQNFDIAQSTFSSYEASASLYARLARSSSDLANDHDRLARVTETVNKAVALSGTNAATASAALFQFGQGLAADALRGEELNSVLEGTPALARAIADGLGVSIGALRAMAAEGELTAERVISAIESQTDVIDASFSEIQPTISQAGQVLSDSIGQLIYQFDEAAGVSKDVAAALILVANGINAISAVIPAAREEVGEYFSLWENTRRELETIQGLMDKAGIPRTGITFGAEPVPPARQALRAEEPFGTPTPDEAYLARGPVGPMPQRENIIAGFGLPVNKADIADLQDYTREKERLAKEAERQSQQAANQATREAEAVRKRREEFALDIDARISGLEQLRAAQGESPAAVRAVETSIKVQEEARRLGIDLDSEAGRALQQRIEKQDALTLAIQRTAEAQRAAAGLGELTTPDFGLKVISTEGSTAGAGVPTSFTDTLDQLRAKGQEQTIANQAADEITKAKVAQDELNELTKEWERVGSVAVNTLSAGITNMITEGGDLKDTFASLGKSLLNMGIQSLLGAGIGGPAPAAGGEATGLIGLLSSFGAKSQFGNDFVVPGGGVDNKTLVARVGGGERVKITPTGNSKGGGGAIHVTIGDIDMRGASTEAIAAVERMERNLPGMIIGQVATMVDTDPNFARQMRA